MWKACYGCLSFMLFTLLSIPIGTFVNALNRLEGTAKTLGGCQAYGDWHVAQLEFFALTLLMLRHIPVPSAVVILSLSGLFGRCWGIQEGAHTSVGKNPPTADEIPTICERKDQGQFPYTCATLKHALVPLF